MPIIYKKANERQFMKPKDYRNESELQELLAEHPELILADEEQSLTLVQREVGLGNAGILDLLLIDYDGRPTVVEVKLERNGESRRSVVGQVFDYVSSLSNYTVDELDQIVCGKLRASIAKLAQENSQEEISIAEKVWKSCGTNLRSGMVRVVIAVDRASLELERIVRFLNDHSDLDVRLVSITKYETKTNEVILVPRLIVYGEQEGKVVTKTVVSRRIAPQMQELLVEYEKIAPAGFSVKKVANDWAYIHHDDWPWGIHYEFNFHEEDNSYSVQIHHEDAKLPNISSPIVNKLDEIKQTITTANISWDSKASRGRGRLIIRFPANTPIGHIASAMKILLDFTGKEIGELIEESSQTNNNE